MNKQEKVCEYCKEQMVLISGTFICESCEDSPYCKVCGACGCIGCCSPELCKNTNGCKYPGYYLEKEY